MDREGSLVSKGCAEIHVEFQASCPGNLFWFYFNTNCGILLWPWLLPISSASGSAYLGILWYTNDFFLFFILSFLPPSPNTLLCEYQYRVMDLDYETMDNFLTQKKKKKKKSRLGAKDGFPPQSQIWFFSLLFFPFHLPLLLILSRSLLFSSCYSASSSFFEMNFFLHQGFPQYTQVSGKQFWFSALSCYNMMFQDL